MNDSLGDYLHFISDIPTEPHQAKNTKESIAAALIKKKECEGRAMKLLQFLVEGKIRSEVFLRCINFLNRAYYQDVVEERSITNLCGYCLCENTLPKMTEKKFCIDSKNNKVYDITNRKKYCSNFCYKASLHIENQIDDSPLWLRTYEVLPTYTLLPSTDKGLPGEDLNPVINISNKEEVQFDSSFSFAQASLQEVSEMVTTTEQSVKQEKHQKLRTPIIEDVSQSRSDVDNKVQFTEQLKNTKPKTTKRNNLTTLKNYILEWLSLDTYIFLFGLAHVRERAMKLNLTVPTTTTMQRNVNQLCRKLELVNFGENKRDKMPFQQELKPLPSYNQLKKDNKDIGVKVRSFYSGDTYNVSSSTEGKVETNDVDDTLAIKDSPNLVRQEIFLTNINTAIKTLTEHLSVQCVNILTKIELLVKTFSLQPYSVVFQPAEWSLIALILIKMLTLRDVQIRELFESKVFSDFLKATILSLRGVQVMINELLKSVEDIDMFLLNYLTVDHCSDKK